MDSLELTLSTQHTTEAKKYHQNNCTGFSATPFSSASRAEHATTYDSYATICRSIGLDPSGEWVYSLSVSLEELFTQKHLRFGISPSYISGRSITEIDTPAGCRPGTRILCRNVGHEWKPGVYQDIAFVIDEAPHDRFIRLFDDLIMDVRLPWVDSLRRQGGKVPFMGIDGRSLIIQIDCPRDKTMQGCSIVKGGGMPIRARQGGRQGKFNYPMVLHPTTTL